MKTVKLSVWSNAAYMKSNERERMVAYLCEYDGKCPMYEIGKCVCEDLFLGWIKCPHARRIQDSGLTKKAKSFGVAARRWREQYATDIKIENKQLCVCGDYIFLPYPHLDVYGSKVFPDIVADHFLLRENFDIAHIRRLIHWHPQALMGGYISSYQENEVPKFIRQLHDVFPDIYAEYVKALPEDKERLESICGSYIGRKAYLKTLNDGAIYIDCHHNKWVKHGEYLVCEDYSTWRAIGRIPGKCAQQIMGDEIIQVESNEWVSSATVFAE